MATLKSLVDETTNIKNELVECHNNLKNNLIEKGVECSDTDKMPSLIDKVKNISNVPPYIKQVVGKINGIPSSSASKFGNAVCVEDKIYRFYKNSLCIYDCVNDTYELETLDLDISESQVQEYFDGNIYITGAKKLFIYNIETKTITNGTNTYSFYRYMRSTMIDENIYIVGGYTTSTSGNSMSSANRIYNCLTDTWTIGTSYPTTIAYHTINNYNNFIYVFGGHNRDLSTKTCRKYDIESKIWTAISNRPAGSHEISGFKYKDKQYVFGGYDTGSKDVSIYNYIEDTWETGTGVPGLATSPICVPYKNGGFMFSSSSSTEQIRYIIL